MRKTLTAVIAVILPVIRQGNSASGAEPLLNPGLKQPGRFWSVQEMQQREINQPLIATLLSQQHPQARLSLDEAEHRENQVPALPRLGINRKSGGRAAKPPGGHSRQSLPDITRQQQRSAKPSLSCCSSSQTLLGYSEAFIPLL